MLAGKKLGVIGVGKLGEALVSGLLKNSAIRKEDIAGSVHYENSIQRVKERLGIEVSLDNRAVAQSKDVVLLAVKPQNMDHVVREIAPNLQPNQVLITVAAVTAEHRALYTPCDDNGSMTEAASPTRNIPGSAKTSVRCQEASHPVGFEISSAVSINPRTNVVCWIASS